MDKDLDVTDCMFREFGECNLYKISSCYSPYCKQNKTCIYRKLLELEQLNERIDKLEEKMKG